MRKEYDFSKAKRAKDVPAIAALQASAGRGKTRITLYLDDDVLESFRERASAMGRGYQTLVNEALRQAIRPETAPVTAENLRQILREELHPA